MIHRRFTIPSALGEPIRGDIRYLESGTSIPVVVICHGFKGFKDWGFHPYLGTRLAQAGFAALHFNFSRNGVGEDLQEFTELDRFQRNTSSIELSDLETILSALMRSLREVPLDPSRIGLMGHSRGGGLAILAAASHPAVRALVTWASVSTFDRFTDENAVKLWRLVGYLETLNSRTGQMMPMGIEFLDDLRANKEKLDILAAASRLQCPFRLIHGTADESVSFLEAGAIRGHAKGTAPVELVPIEGAGHTFGAAHPWAGTTEHLEAAIDATIGWFSKHLAVETAPAL